MPLNVPTLDDRSYADLVREGIELIPRYAPEWTNHNAADPGITLVELFAYLAEIYLYRVDRVSEANKTKFLKLLLGRDAAPPRGTVDRQLEEAVAALRRPFRAVSGEDFERLAIEAIAQSQNGAVARVQCFPRRNLEAHTEEERRRDRPGHVSLVFVPRHLRLPDEDVRSIRDAIRQYVEPRRLLTTRLHVVGPRYVDVGLRVRIAPLPGRRAADIEDGARGELERFFDPHQGGAGGSGWPLGRSLYVSDVYRILGTSLGAPGLTGIDVDVPDARRLRRNEMGEVVGVQLGIGELLRAHVAGVACERRARP